MKSQTKWIVLLIFSCLLFLFSACTPIPNCDLVYNVTKPDDTNDGVCSPGDCSLREAVANANACPGSRTINLPADGYILTIDGDDEDFNETGDLDVRDDLIIIGTGAPSISGNIERAFHIHNGVTATFEGIWLTSGDAIYGGGLVNEGDLTLNNFTCNYNNVSIPPGGMGDAMGGCIFNAGDLIIDNGHFLENTAGFGGAVYNYDGATLSIEGGSFTGNLADTHGGAIWNGIGSDLVLNDSNLDFNVAGLNGGGLWSHGNVTGENLVFEDNAAAGSGGGIFSWESSAIFSNVWVTQNTASLGGGIYNDHSMVHFYESGLTANHAFGNGGAVNNFDSNPAYPTGGLLMSNVTISGNTAGAGAGIYNSGNFDLRFITVADNNPEGIRIDAGNEIKLRSSILSNNTGGDCAGITPDSLDYNLTSDSTCALTGSHEILNVTALIEPLGFHGGIAPSHPLTYGSPALDSGVPDLCISYDQNNTTRPQGAWCDRGAFENLYDKGILRGWTYIDANRNDIRDPSEGGVSGMIMELKEGPCPGGAIAAITLSNPDGLYRKYEIEPGDYCIDTSPLQQTMYPEYINVSFAAGDVLEDVNFRYLLSPLGDSSISGKVWHDECAVPYSIPTSTPPGCIAFLGGGYGADGIYDPSEPGIEGVKVELFYGGCPANPLAISAEVYTDANGDFIIPGLSDASWCVKVNAHASPNDSILIPGNWTYPVRNASPAVAEVVLGTSEDLVDINFGWDYQFLPEPLIPYSYLCTVNMDAFMRRGPGTDFLGIAIIPEGAEFEVFAKSEKEEPLWLFGKSEKNKYGWMSEAVLICGEPDTTKLETRWTPLRIPTPTPTPVPPAPIVCTPDLPENKCIRAGGTYIRINDKQSICSCP
jgi:CSLREA domain-containing protein